MPQGPSKPSLREVGKRNDTTSSNVPEYSRSQPNLYFQDYPANDTPQDRGDTSLNTATSHDIRAQPYLFENLGGPSGNNQTQITGSEYSFLTQQQNIENISTNQEFINTVFRPLIDQHTNLSNQPGSEAITGTGNGSVEISQDDAALLRQVNISLQLLDRHRSASQYNNGDNSLTPDLQAELDTLLSNDLAGLGLLSGEGSHELAHSFEQTQNQEGFSSQTPAISQEIDIDTSFSETTYLSSQILTLPDASLQGTGKKRKESGDFSDRSNTKRPSISSDLGNQSDQQTLIPDRNTDLFKQGAFVQRTELDCINKFDTARQTLETSTFEVGRLIGMTEMAQMTSASLEDHLAKLRQEKDKLLLHLRQPVSLLPSFSKHYFEILRSEAMKPEYDQGKPFYLNAFQKMDTWWRLFDQGKRWLLGRIDSQIRRVDAALAKAQQHGQFVQRTDQSSESNNQMS